MPKATLKWKSSGPWIHAVSERTSIGYAIIRTAESTPWRVLAAGYGSDQFQWPIDAKSWAESFDATQPSKDA